MGVGDKRCHRNSRASGANEAAAVHELEIFSIDSIACKPEKVEQASLEKAIFFTANSLIVAQLVSIFSV